MIRHIEDPPFTYARSAMADFIAHTIELRSRLLLFVIWIIAYHCLLVVAARADFRVLERTTRSLHVLFSGAITEGDLKAFQELSPELERNDFSVFLDSKGGDVVAAMQIGRLIRKYDGYTWIGWDSVTQKFDPKCYSSCALIFIAGVLRVISDEGTLGLHRPYLASAPQDRQVLEKRVPIMLEQVRRYVAEMGVTDNFYQQMVNTEPSSMVLYGGKIQPLGMPKRQSYTKLVPEDDPVYQEIEISYNARFYGVTTAEMRQ